MVNYSIKHPSFRVLPCCQTLTHRTSQSDP